MGIGVGYGDRKGTFFCPKKAGKIFLRVNIM